jgi:hypothetical protein
VAAHVTDQAGNPSSDISATMLYDVTVPALGGISFPAFLNGGSSVSFLTQANDNVDLGTATMWLRYPIGFTEQFEFPSTTLGTFGSDVFTTSANVSLTVAFMRSLQTAGPGAPPAALQPPDQVSAVVLDVATNSSAISLAPILPTSIPVTGTAAPSTNWQVPTNFTWAITQLNGAAPAAINVNRDATAVSPNVNSVSITACASGNGSAVPPALQNPFTSRVEFWVQAAGATWRKIGQSTAPTVTDNGATRNWCFTATWDPEAAYTAPFPAGNTAVNIIAIGVNQIPVGGTLPAGDGLATQVNANVTVVVP